MMTVSFARIASWSGWARLPASVAIAGLIFALIGSLPGGACRALAGLATGAMALSDAPHVQSLAQSGLHLAFMAEVRRNGFGGLVGTVVLAGARGFFEGGVIGHVVAVVGFALTRSLPMSMAISGVGIVRAALQDRDRPTRCIIAAIATITGLATTINPDLIDTVANVVTAAAVIASVGALVKGPRLIGGIGIVGCVVSYAPIKHLRLAVGSGGLALLLVCYTVGVDGIGQDPSGSPSKVDKEPSVGSTLTAAAFRAGAVAGLDGHSPRFLAAKAELKRERVVQAQQEHDDHPLEAPEVDADAMREYLMLWLDMCDGCARHMLAFGPAAAPRSCHCGGGMPQPRCVCEQASCPARLLLLPTVDRVAARQEAYEARVADQARRKAACAQCGSPASPGRSLLVCEGCKTSGPYYCNVKCQKLAWRDHRSTCFSKRPHVKIATCQDTADTT